MKQQTLKTLGEAGWIDWLTQRSKASGSAACGVGRGVVLGIGDDAAVLRMPGSVRSATAHSFTRRARGTARSVTRRVRGASGSAQYLLFASDMIVEDVHFRWRNTPAHAVGWKALAVNVSDIAAMGGVPLAAVVSLGAPPRTRLKRLRELDAGLRRCAQRFGVALVGGDTVRAHKLVLDVAILGTVSAAQLCLRSGARVGDRVYVTGRLGGAYVSGRHARLSPRLAEAQALLRCIKPTAMLDLSDGLAQGLRLLCAASRVGMTIEAQRIPCHAKANLNAALYEGEDFELLFTLSPRLRARVPQRLGQCPVTCIGTVTPYAQGLWLEETTNRGIKRMRLKPKAYAHF